MPQPDCVGVGIIGLGVGRQLADAVATSPYGKVVAVCDINSDLLARACRDFPGASAHKSAHALLENPRVEAVVIATPDNQHADLTIRALRSGKAVFCEKPLASSRRELENLTTAYDSVHGEVTLTTNTLLRVAPRYAWLKDLIDTGGLGEIVGAQVGYFYGRFHKVVDGWRGAIPDYSVTLGGGIHMIDLLCWLLGEYPTRVTAAGASEGSRASGLAIQDTVEAILEFPSLGSSCLSVVFASAHPHFHQATIHGSARSFMNLPDGRAILMSRKGEYEDIHLAPAPANKGVLMENFLLASQGLEKPTVSARDALAMTRVALAIDESVQRAEPVRLDWGP